MIVAIIADRIDQPDAQGGFILDGFPRTVPQAEALERLLAERGLKLDAVIALVVNEGILLERIEKRVADMTARGEALRADDNPEVLRERLAAYRAQTAPLIDHYAARACCAGRRHGAGRGGRRGHRRHPGRAPAAAPARARSGRPAGRGPRKAAAERAEARQTRQKGRRPAKRVTRKAKAAKKPAKRPRKRPPDRRNR